MTAPTAWRCWPAIEQRDRGRRGRASARSRACTGSASRTSTSTSTRRSARRWRYFVIFAVFVDRAQRRALPLGAHAARLPDHARRLPGGVGRLHRRHRRHVHDRLADGADDDPGHGHGDAGLHPLALRRAAAGALGRRAPGVRARQQVRRLHGVDLRHRGRASPRLRCPTSARSARWASGWRSASAPPGSSSSRSSPPCRRSCARRRSRSVRAASIGFERFARVAAALQLPLALAAGRRGAGALGRRRGGACSASPACVAPMPLLTDPVEYMNHSAPLYRDIKRLRPITPGLSVTHVWLKGALGSVSEPDGAHRPASLPAGARGRPGRRRGGRA